MAHDRIALSLCDCSSLWRFVNASQHCSSHTAHCQSALRSSHVSHTRLPEKAAPSSVQLCVNSQQAHTHTRIHSCPSVNQTSCRCHYHTCPTKRVGHSVCWAQAPAQHQPPHTATVCTWPTNICRSTRLTTRLTQRTKHR